MLATVLIIILIIAILLFQASIKQVKREVILEGGLRTIFSTLDDLLKSEHFVYNEDQVSSIEYRRNIDQYSYLLLTLRKCFRNDEPYEMQMFQIVTGEVKIKTIPYTILPHHTKNQLSDCLVRMLHEMASKKIN